MKKKYLKISIILILIGLIASSFFSLDFFTSWRVKLTDKLFLQEEVNKEIIIISIDNESLQKIGRWPWNRNIHAQLVNIIAEQKPAVIGLDVNFPEKSSLLADKELAQAINNANNVILPIETELTLGNQKNVFSNALWPVEEIKDSAVGLGVVNTPLDKDGIFRKLPIKIYSDQGEEYSPFFIEIANLYLKNKGLDSSLIPTDKKGLMLVNYLGKPGTFITISASDVIEGNLEIDLLKNKIILIGATAPDLHDEQITPVSSNIPMSGVEIHANAVNTVLSNQFLIPLNFYLQIIILIGLALIIGFILIYFKIIIGSLIALSVFATYLISALVVFDKGIILDLFYPLVVFILTFIFSIIWKYSTERKEKKYIRNTFSRYVSPDVISEILADPNKLGLTGQKKELTILFSDIRGFTSISEKLSPEKLIELLNQYFTLMTDLIMESGGAVDKYIGDAIMAFWGAPLDDPNHSDNACKIGLAMIKELELKREEWIDKFGVDLRIGIGINTGPVIIGNIGSDKRFDYTVIGDSVNLASRLEGLTKEYGIELIVSQFTKDQASKDFVFKYLDEVRVKGKEEEVKIYQLVK